MEITAGAVRASPNAGEDSSRSGAVVVRLFGPVRIERHGRAVRLPPSRKVCALLGFLALSTRPVLRSHLCDVLWDVANDPRGELRWCLTKLRSVIDDPNRRRLVTDGQWIGLDASDLEIDATQFRASVETAIAARSPEELRRLIELVDGELLEGLEAGFPPRFQNWLAAQRQEFAALSSRALAALAAHSPLEAPEKLSALRRLLDLAPFEDAAHVDLLTALAARRAYAAGERHLVAVAAAYRREGLDPSTISSAWARLRQRGTVAATATREGDDPAAQEGPRQQSRARLLVASFAAESGDRLITDGLTRDVAIGLARLRSVAVIAPASAFALHARGFYALEAGRTVGADYVAAGRLARYSDHVRLTLELIEVAHSRLVWAEEWSIAFGDAHEAATAITEQIVSRLAAEIELSECNRAILKPAACLSAWEAHHRGLWHLHLFTRADNEAAQRYFKQAIALDPGLSRAHAGLSYAHWMNAFAFRPGERAAERDRAFEAAGAGLHADPKDPAALWSMSRALWMRNDEAESLRTINRAIELSPSFALARHSRSFVESQTGDAARAVKESRVAQNLSPFDPWRYAMHGVEAFGLVRLGRFKEAATAARQMTRKPNAHVQARGLAALVLVLSGDLEGGRAEIAVVKRLQPRYTVADFLAAYHVVTPLERLFRRAAARIGIG